jgi:hypothetical protein
VLSGGEKVDDQRVADGCPDDSRDLHFDKISDNHLKKKKRGPWCEREEEGERVCKGRLSELINQ